MVAIEPKSVVRPLGFLFRLMMSFDGCFRSFVGILPAVFLWRNPIRF